MVYPDIHHALYKQPQQAVENHIQTIAWARAARHSDARAVEEEAFKDPSSRV